MRAALGVFVGVLKQSPRFIIGIDGVPFDDVMERRLEGIACLTLR